MELLNFIFRLGVVFAIFGFLFGLFEIGLTLLRSGRRRTMPEEYIVKFIKYIFLVDVAFLFCLDISGSEISQYHLVVTTLVLLMYFIGKLQNSQQQQAMFQVMENSFMNIRSNFDLRAEILVITTSIILFVLFIFFPEWASNPASIWFHESILNIEDTPVFGFIFKVIGFFFMISILVRLFNSFMYLLSGKAFMEINSGAYYRKEKKEDDFDDYEELK